MIRTQLTDIIIVLDRSGSMASVRDATIDAFNGYVRSQQDGPGNVQLSLIQFDDQYEPVMTCVPIAKVRDLDTRTYQPRGCTALLDAIGRTIVSTGKRLRKMRENERPDKVLFVVQTDGFENASKQFKPHQISEMIAEQRDKYSWQFVFLGANQDAIMSAARFGIPAAAALSYGGTQAGTMAAFNALGARTRAYREAQSPEEVMNACMFQEHERRQAKD